MNIALANTEKKKFIVTKKRNDFHNFTIDEVWNNVSQIEINANSYLWKDNRYTPSVIVKAFHTEKDIYLYFKVFEKRINIKHTKFGDDVWKDSCVEFFINPFPKYSEEYFNIEINAMGVPLIGVGEADNDSKRYYFNEEEVKDWEIIPSITEPINGEHGSDYWTLHYRIPKSFFENYYGKLFDVKNGIANFYKCGDETEFEHYGAWSKIESAEPNFHLPQYFGKICFSDKSSESH